MRGLSLAALILLVAGAINWGLIGLFGFNLVAAIFRVGWLIRLVYIVVGLAGGYGLFMIGRLSSSRDDICVPGHTAGATTPTM